MIAQTQTVFQPFRCSYGQVLVSYVAGSGTQDDERSETCNVSNSLGRIDCMGLQSSKLVVVFTGG